MGLGERQKEQTQMCIVLNTGEQKNIRGKSAFGRQFYLGEMVMSREKFGEMINRAKKIVAFTGAGISAES